MPFYEFLIYQYMLQPFISLLLYALYVVFSLFRCGSVIGWDFTTRALWLAARFARSCVGRVRRKTFWNLSWDMLAWQARCDLTTFRSCFRKFLATSIFHSIFLYQHFPLATLSSFLWSVLRPLSWVPEPLCQKHVIPHHSEHRPPISRVSRLSLIAMRPLIGHTRYACQSTSDWSNNQ